MHLIDVSRVVSSETAVWPGDQPPTFTWTTHQSEGDAVSVGAITISVHTGTHADAPLHYKEGAAAIDELPLRPFIGPATVLDVGDANVICPRHVKPHAHDLARRVLFKTPHSELGPDQWQDAFPSVAPETVRWLGQRGVVLIGTDTPSIDPVDSASLPAHHELLQHGIVNLEYLNLSGVAPGTYRLIAFPLRLKGLDASPVRAVLIDEPSA